ncbi:LppX_LprAFG lipoprotein [Nocardioides terrisoli]|uniref:LppX_LprAFG lipoprotein n=1 Tax=Nocardioides terrisoli TaxID=3388267 RepID=UPI00287B9D06|nr:LppX_LprAFG lipoprotein [Nocardioides marmorisolisilvae]
MNRSRALALAAVSTTAVLGLTGCGGSSAAGHSTSAPVSSPSGSTGTTTGSATAGRLTKADFVQTVSSAVGAQKTAHVAVRSQLLKVDGDVSYAGKASAMAMTLAVNGQKGEVRIVDGVLYMSMPGLTPAGKFVKLTASDPNIGPLIGQIRNFGPQGNLEAMSKGLQKVQYIGADTVDGAKVDHYKVTVDARAMLKQMGTAVPKAAKDKIPHTVTYDMYLDSNHLMRRIVIDLMGQQTRVDVTNWGKPVHISAPPASDLVAKPKA